MCPSSIQKKGIYYIKFKREQLCNTTDKALAHSYEIEQGENFIPKHCVVHLSE